MKGLNSQLVAFIAVVEAGSITAAADLLNITKSAVSQHLQILEARLGVRLLTRTTRKQSLTPIGTRYFQRCKELVQLALVAEDEVRSYTSEPAGRLRISAPHAAVETKIVPTLRTLVKQYPDLRPSVVVTDLLLDLVKEDIDVAVVVGNVPDSNYRIRNIGAVDMVLCASTCYINERGLTSREMNQSKKIAQLNYIANECQGSPIEHTFTHNKSNKEVSISFSPTVVVSNIDAVQCMVRGGVGVAYLPEFLIARDLAEGDLQKLMSNYIAETAPLRAIHPYGDLPPIGVREFIETIKKQYELFIQGKSL